MANNQSVFDEARISFSEFEKLKVSNYANRPNQKSAYGSGLNADQTKSIFDAQGEYLARKHELLIDNLEPMALNEIDRKQSEKARKEAEKARAAAETARAAAETERDANERERKSEEDRRYDAELERVNAEQDREANERIRIENENARVESEARREILVGDLDAALDELHAYAQALIGGGGA